jgi:hypothetical protein
MLLPASAMRNAAVLVKSLDMHHLGRNLSNKTLDCARDSTFRTATCQGSGSREELKKTFNEIERHKSRKTNRICAIISANGIARVTDASLWTLIAKRDPARRGP